MSQAKDEQPDPSCSRKILLEWIPSFYLANTTGTPVPMKGALHPNCVQITTFRAENTYQEVNSPYHPPCFPQHPPGEQNSFFQPFFPFTQACDLSSLNALIHSLKFMVANTEQHMIYSTVQQQRSGNK